MDTTEKETGFGICSLTSHFGCTELHNFIHQLLTGFQEPLFFPTNCCVTNHTALSMEHVAISLCHSITTSIPRTLQNEAVTDLVWVVDSDLKASQDLASRRVLVHRDLELALRAVLSVESGRVVVEVHHPDRHCRDVKVWQLLAAPYLWCLRF